MTAWKQESAVRSRVQLFLIFSRNRLGSEKVPDQLGWQVRITGLFVRTRNDEPPSSSAPDRKFPLTFFFLLHNWFVCSLSLLLKWAFFCFSVVIHNDIPKISHMARSVLMPNVKGYKSIMVSLPETFHVVKYSYFHSQKSESNDG